MVTPSVTGVLCSGSGTGALNLLPLLWSPSSGPGPAVQTLERASGCWDEPWVLLGQYPQLLEKRQLQALGLNPELEVGGPA